MNEAEVLEIRRETLSLILLLMVYSTCYEFLGTASL